MQKRLFFLLIVLFSLSACGGKNGGGIVPDDIINEDITYSEEIDLAQSIPLPIAIDTVIEKALATNYQSYLDQYNTSSSKVTSVKMTKLSMRVTVPQSQNFDFIDSVSVFVYANDLNNILAAKKMPFPKGSRFVEFDVIDQDLKQYFLRDSLFVRVHGHLNSLPGAGTKLDLSTTFNLKANPL